MVRDSEPSRFLFEERTALGGLQNVTPAARSRDGLGFQLHSHSAHPHRHPAVDGQHH